MIDRRAKKPLRAWILDRTDAELTYCREELAREQKRRRIQVRERRIKRTSANLEAMRKELGPIVKALIESDPGRW